MKYLLLSYYCLFALNSEFFAQINSNTSSKSQTEHVENLTSYFEAAYSTCPDVPKGLLEAVSYTNTHFRPIAANQFTSCTGMPLPYGIMGVFENGANYFSENGKKIAQLSGISIVEQKSSVELQILAYAKAVEQLVLSQSNVTIEELLPKIYAALTAIPNAGMVNQFAQDVELFGWISFLNDPKNAQQYAFPAYKIDVRNVFGENNSNILSAKKIRFTSGGIQSEYGETYQLLTSKSTEYGPAIWTPAATCNYSSRSGTAISAVTIHTIEGTYASCISWFQNCSASVSAHYVMRSSDGQVTQMVDEADKAWHVGTENPYTIGIEHEGYTTDSTWYTQAMYVSSADLVRDITNSGYGIPPLRTYYGPSSSGSDVLGACIKIKGHQHYPNQTHTDPGIYWKWEKYYRLINNNPTVTTITSTSGTLTDSGGSGGNYSDDERIITTVAPPNTAELSLQFTTFQTELNYDKLFLYNGNSIDAPLLGAYSGATSPGIVNASSGAITLEFRSDCATTDLGWEAIFSSTASDTVQPITLIASDTAWKTADFQATFSDTDNYSGISGRYYLVSDQFQNQIAWKSNGNMGFVHEEFEQDMNSWTQQTGVYNLQAGKLHFSDSTQQNSNAYTTCVQNALADYVYEWQQTITSTQSNQRAGLHFFCSDPTLPNRGNSYFVYFRQGANRAQIYKVVNDVFAMESDDTCVVNTNEMYSYRISYSPATGWIKAYCNGILVTSWQDVQPLQSGNAISLRSGGCAVNFDAIHVFKNRSTTITVNVTDDIRYESYLGQQAGKVYSLVIDSAGNWSPVSEQAYFVDKTAPVLSFLNDGNSSDVDVSYSDTLHANWLFTDSNSFVAHYEYAVGTAPLTDNVIAWTPDSLNLTMSELLTAPQYNQLYYVSVRAYNRAGLFSTVSSDGQVLINTASVDENGLKEVTLYPNPVIDVFHIGGVNGTVSMQVYNTSGSLIYTTEVNGNADISLAHLAQGIYHLILRSGNAFTIKKLVKE